MPKAPVPATISSGGSRTGGLLQVSLFFLVLLAGAGIYLTPIPQWLSQGQLLKAELAQFGWAAPAVFVGASALATAVGAPRLVLCSLAGIAFGASYGILWSQAGTLIGAYATFLMVRATGREAILRRYPRLGKFARRIQSRGLLSVLIIRQFPMNGFYNNLLLGLSPVSHRDFLAGSFLGFLPLGMTAVLIGAGVVQTSMTQAIQYIAAGLAASVLLGFALKWWIGSAKESADSTPLAAGAEEDGISQ